MARSLKKKAQSTLEYLLVLTAIVAVILWAAVQWIRPAVRQAFIDTRTAIGNTADKMTPPQAPQPPPGPR